MKQKQKLEFYIRISRLQTYIFKLLLHRRRNPKTPSPSPPTEVNYCVTCLMIEMGDMVCYTALCPQCNRVPPGRRDLSPERRQRERKRKYSFKMGRKHSVEFVKEKEVSTKLSQSSAGGKTNKLTHPRLHTDIDRSQASVSKNKVDNYNNK